MHERRIAGTMSGTSADGVDVALVIVRGRGLGMTARLERHHHRPYDADLRRRIFAVRGTGAVPLAGLARLGRSISLACAEAVNEALAAEGWQPGQIAAVAAH